MDKIAFLFVIILLLAIPLTCYGQEEYEIYGIGDNEVIMRPRYDYDLTHQYKGTIEDDGYVRLKPRFDLDLSKTLRGYIDEDGYGRLHDMDGNYYRVRPKY